MKRLLIIALLLLLPACTETHEKHFTAEELCKDKKKYDDPDDLRDEYDQCILFKEENLRNDNKCEDRCKNYCGDEDMKFRKSRTDFSGCYCTCSEKVEIKK